MLSGLWEFIGVFGYELTSLMALIPPLIIVIGIPNCIYLINKYQQEFKNHGDKLSALDKIIQKVGNATFLTNATTALGFGTFVFTNSSIMIEFVIDFIYKYSLHVYNKHMSCSNYI